MPDYKKWFALFALSLSVFVLAFNTTAVINALPIIREHFDISAASLQWIINAYILAAATTILIAGKLGDIFDRKLLFIFGAFFFTIVSILIAVSNNTPTIITGRLLQGVAAAFIAAGSLSILKNVFDKKELGFAIGIWVTGIGGGNAFGPYGGGLLTDILSWRYVFWLDAVIMAFVVLISFSCLPNNLTKERKNGKFDFLGFILSVTAVFMLVYGLSESQILGWLHPLTYILLIGGIILFCVFIKVELTVENPLIHLEFFKKKVFVLANIGIFVVLLVEIAIPYFLNFYLQNCTIFNYTAGEAGKAVLPFSISLLIFTFLSVFISRFLGYKYAVINSLILLFFGLLIFSITLSQTFYSGLVVAMILCGAGIGICDPVLSVLGMNALPQENSGEASGIINTVVYLGEMSAISLGSICFFVFGRNSISSVTTITNVSVSQNFLDKLLLGNNSDYLKLLTERLPSDDLAFITVNIVKNSAVYGFIAVVFFCMIMVLVIALIAIFGLTKKDYVDYE